ncbi:MAG: metallophosphoesterase, partial [Blastocatellia bacterium]|nr:metallophosphoesterase [Blastocatellia bacterium]
MNTSDTNRRSYDIIGDIHGYAEALESLLRKLGYTEQSGVWRHPGGRKALFLGDYIDRGPSIRRTVQVVRSMVEAGEAQAIMGNHEYNALLYHTQNADGNWLRPHTAKNVKLHATTLAQYSDHEEEWDDCLAWFAKLPIDLGGLRVVHASWDERLIAAHPQWKKLSDDLLRCSAIKGTPEYTFCDTLLKGPEIPLPPGHTFQDIQGTVRTKIRVKWWLSSAGRTYHELCMPPTESVTHLPVPVELKSLCGGYP